MAYVDAMMHIDEDKSDNMHIIMRRFTEARLVKTSKRHTRTRWLQYGYDGAQEATRGHIPHVMVHNG